MVCKSCGTTLKEGMLFCPKCGTENVVGVEVEQAVEARQGSEVEQETGSVKTGKQETEGTVCTRCGSENKAGSVFCYKCGGSLRQNTPPKLAFQVPKNLKKIISVGLMAIILVGASYTIIQSGLIVKKQPSLFYIKEGTLWSSSVKKKPIEISDEIYKNQEETQMSSMVIPEVFQYSKDQNYLFFPKDYRGDVYDLYYMKNNKKVDAKKIDSDVIEYRVLSNNLIVYRDQDGNMYLHNLKEKDKVASDVETFFISKDEKKIAWQEADGALYIQDLSLKVEKKKLASEIGSVIGYTDSLSKWVILESENLYEITEKDKKKIGSHVARSKVYVEGETLKVVYGIQNTTQTPLTLMDFVTDPDAQKDAQVLEPNVYDYQQVQWVDTYWGLRQQLVTDDAYYTAMETYNEKCERDYLRKTLKDTPIYWQEEEIFLYNSSKGKSQSLKKGYFNNTCFFGQNSKDVAFLYGTVDPKEITPVSLLGVEAWVLEEQIKEQLFKKCQVVLRTETTEIGLDYNWEELNTYSSQIDEAKQNIYVLAHNINKGKNDLRKISYEAKYFGEDQKIDNEVKEFGLLDNGTVYYYKGNVEEGKGDFYINCNKVDSDVWTAYSLADGKNFIYFKDRNMQDLMSTVCIYDGKQSKEVAEDVYDCLAFAPNKIALLMEYDLMDYEGDLNYYNGKEIKEIDTDVTSLLK